MKELVDKVQKELARYEHPLFAFSAQPAGERIEVEIRFKAPEVNVHRYHFHILPREVESPQFSWNFQRQLYDCLHDYVIEMFSRNPQMKEY